jgi:hypothetical protein
MTMKHSREEIAKVLVEKWNYEDFMVEDVLKVLFGMNEALQDAFDAYLETFRFPDEPKVFGLSPAVIDKEYTFAPPAVFLLLNWISREPEEALQSLVKENHRPLPDDFDAAQYNEWQRTKSLEESK